MGNPDAAGNRHDARRAAPRARRAVCLAAFLAALFALTGSGGALAQDRLPQWSPAGGPSPQPANRELGGVVRRFLGSPPGESQAPPPSGQEGSTPRFVVRAQSGYDVDGAWSTPSLAPRSAVPPQPALDPASPVQVQQSPSHGTAYGPPTPGATSSQPVYSSPAPPPQQPLGGSPTLPGDPLLPGYGGDPLVGGAPAPPGFFGGPVDGSSPFWEEPPPPYVELVPQVFETQTGRLMLGVGVNSDAGLVGSLVIDEQNFDWRRFPRSLEDIRNGTAWRGAGQRFRFEAVPGTQVGRYLVSFNEPYLFDTQVGLGLSASYFTRRYSEWDEQRLGGRVGLTYQFTHDLSGTFAFRGASVDGFNPAVPTPPELTRALGKSGLYGFEGRLTHDTRDNPFLATEGHLLEVSFEQVVGTFVYPRGEVDLRRYFLLHQRPDRSGRHVLALTGRMSLTGDDTPVYDNHFAGGFSSLRGFAFRGVSPRTMGVAVGGRFMLLASAEYLFPITADDMIRGVFFCDTGTVERSISNWESRYRVAPGFGLRIAIPAMGPAPIALDFAFPVSKDPADDEQVFSFYVGFLR